MTYLSPPANLRKKVNPDGAKSAGPLLHGWARRTSRGMVATPRHVRALVNYLPTASASVYASLGGGDTLEWANKAVDAIGLDDAEAVSGENEILVLGLPYGGPNGGKDTDQQYFSPMTDFMDGVNEKPPVMYTHGTQNGFEPEPVGSVKARWYDRRGGWFKVQLDPQSPRYAQLLDAHASGNLRASTGVVPASYAVAPSGHVDTWLVGELSLVDLRSGYRPVNGYAITKAVASDVIFTDYYGDPVMAPSTGTDIKAAFKLLWDLIMKHDKDHEVIVEALDQLDEYEQVIESEGDGVDMADSTGFIDPYFKAEKFGGKKRSALDNSDFVFPDERKFPIVDQEDLNSATRLWSQYKGKHSRAEFEAGVRRLAKKHKLTLPDAWMKAEAIEEPMEPNTETGGKCEACDEAKRQADLIKAELAAPAKCGKCVEAVQWVRSMVKAAKMSPQEAFTYLDTFSASDETYDTVKATVEARTPLGMSKAVQDGLNLQVVNPQVGVDPQTTVDPEHMNKQRRLAGLPTK